MEHIGFFMLNDRVPLKTDDVPASAEENKAVQTEPTNIGQMGFQDDPEYHRTADALEVSYDDRKDPKVVERIQYLLDWAREFSGKEDRLDQVLAIKELRRSLGWTEIGLTSIKKLYQWTRLDSKRRTLEKEMELI